MNNLLKFAEPFGIEMNAQQLDQFEIYQTLLIEWNSRLNLTRIIEPNDILIRHFLDSLTCATVTGNLSGQRVIDVGTGAGFPGLPLKILYPDMRLTLTDSVAKKTRFLQAVVDELGLENVTVVAERAETLGQAAAHRQQYDWALARAVAKLNVLAEYLLPLVKVGGSVLAQKGGTAERESLEATEAVKTLGGDVPSITSVQLPEREEPHFLLTIKKVADTPATYPRKPGKPTKRPLL